jgi:nucleotide-binding universal stress UspA family protein
MNAAPNSALGLQFDNVLVATDFSAASKTALLYGASLARRHRSKLYLAHISTSQSEASMMDAWRAAQAHFMDEFLAGRLDGIQHELMVKSGEVRTMLPQLVKEYKIDLLVVGTRGRAGVWRLLLGSSVAQSILRQADCSVLTVGPNVRANASEAGPQRILVPTGFAPQSLYAVGCASWLAAKQGSQMALLTVVTDMPDASPQEQKRVRDERLEHLRTSVPDPEQLHVAPEFMVEFGSATEKILETAKRWNPDLIVLGVHPVTQASQKSWAKAYEIVRKAPCPVLTVRSPQAGS